MHSSERAGFDLPLVPCWNRPRIPINAHSTNIVCADRCNREAGGGASREGASAPHLVEVPPLGHALEFVLAGILKLDARAGDEVLHGARDEDLGWLSECGDTLGDVNRDTADVVTSHFDLAGV